MVEYESLTKWNFKKGRSKTMYCKSSKVKREAIFDKKRDFLETELLFILQQETYKKTYSSFGRALQRLLPKKFDFWKCFFPSPTKRTISEQQFPVSGSFYHFWIIRKPKVLTVSDSIFGRYHRANMTF